MPDALLRNLAQNDPPASGPPCTKLCLRTGPLWPDAGDVGQGRAGAATRRPQARRAAAAQRCAIWHDPPR